jgi:hypothetical protein
MMGSEGVTFACRLLDFARARRWALLLAKLCASCDRTEPRMLTAPSLGQWIWTRDDIARFAETEAVQPALEAAVCIGAIKCDAPSGVTRAGDPWELPWPRADERRWMYAYVRNGSERYLAPQLFALYLKRLGVSAAQRRAAMQVAGRTYRALIATHPPRRDAYWADSLPGSAAARVIRAAGRRT